MSADRPSPETGTAALTAALAVSFRVLRAVMILVLVAYLFSGVFVVGQHERAFVLIFGRIAGRGTERIKGPGLHWTWPQPIAEIVRVPTERVHTVETAAFWHRSGEPGPTLQPGVDGYALSGDANILHARWAVRYTVMDLETYSFRIQQPDTLLRLELEHAVVKTTGRFPIDQALRTEIEALRDAVDAELRQRVAALDLGVRIERVDILALAPPRQVAAAFAAVIEAEQDRSRQISAARAAAIRMRNEAEGEAARRLAEGEAYRRQIIAEVSARADYFRHVLAEYEKQPAIIARTLRQDSLRRALAGVEQKFILHRNERGEQQLRLLLNPEPVPLGGQP